MKKQYLLIKIFVTLAIISLFILTTFLPSVELLKWMTLVGLICQSCYFLWNDIIWKQKFIPDFISSTYAPNIGGTWEGEFDSDFIDKNGDRIGKRKTYLVINQTNDSIEINFYSNKTESVSNIAQIYKKKNRGWVINYVYENTADASQQLDNPSHFGAGILNILKYKNELRLEGEYWNSRKSKGTLNFKNRSKNTKIFSFTDAEKLFESIKFTNK